MMEEEAYLAFVFRLKPHLNGQVDAHNHDDLLAVRAMAQRLDHYTTSTKGMLAPAVDLVPLGGGREDEEREEEQPKRKGRSM